MPGQSVEISFLGNASGLVGAIQESVQAMSQIQTQSKGFASAMAGIAINAVKPIAGALAGAFVAQQSLKAYAASSLPGSGAFVEQMNATKKAIKGVAESVGEFLAPAAMWASKMIVQIASPLREAIRTFTAFRNSAVDFLKQLGANFLTAFGSIVPTAKQAVDSVMGLFSGPGRDWAKDIENFRKVWNRVWGDILDYTAPIMVAAGGAMEAALQGISVASTAAFEGMKSLFASLGDYLGSSLPAGVTASSMSLTDMAKVVQDGLITAFVGVEYAIENWQQSFDIAKTGILLGVEILRSSFVTLGTDIWENMKVVGENMSAVFRVATENIVTAFKAVWPLVIDGAIATARKIGWLLTNPINAFNVISGEDGMVSLMKSLEKNFPTLPNAPDFSGMKGMPGLKAMPGFTSRSISDDEVEMKAAFDTMMDGFKTNFGPFLGTRMKEIEEAAEAFKKTIMDGLPGFSATPGATVPGGNASNNFAAAYQFGSKEAYSAILKATGGGDKNLKEQQKQTGVLERIETNTKKKPQIATI